MTNKVRLKCCSKCKLWKSITEFYKNKSRKDGLNSWCKCCQKEYQQSSKGKKYYEEYHQKYKNEIDKYSSEYRKTDEYKIAQDKYKHSKKGRAVARKGSRKYQKTDKGKITSDKKQDKRRGYGNIFLFNNPFPKDIPVVGHHISDGFKVYIPKRLHQNHYAGNNKEKHREDLKSYVENIYNISYIVVEFN